MNDYDVIVIGSGAGGGTLVRHLRRTLRGPRRVSRTVRPGGFRRTGPEGSNRS
jgi:pyruvate/2-oxoglutarate dehydrogenase complex dihydrolipoamide dehydrogenase (E3) component